ncbi:MAG: metalloendopeptidase [Sphingobacteriales bacterium 50-39]|nr:M13 family metallopeptidase [Sphingobacteriales bacterium]OJW56032.1 MAG: metalloendopeptidase [Sphingobacteriales bacterium 50-39]
MRIVCLLTSILLILSYTPSSAQGRSAVRTMPPATSALPYDFLARDLDRTTSPVTDFFTYANGGWIKRTPIPPEESSWGIGHLVQEDIYRRLRKISEDAAVAKGPAGSVTQQIGDLWYSGMDSAVINSQKLTPLKETFDRIDNIHTTGDLLRVSAALHRKGIDVLFSDNIGQDDMNSEKMTYQLSQGGLGMPNRDYYFNTAKKPAQVRKAYRHYLFLIFRRLEHDSIAAQQRAEAVFRLETRLAKASRKLEDLRDPIKNYNKLGLDALGKLSPAISWNDWLKDMGISGPDSFIVRQPEFYTALNTELAGTSLADWKNYLRVHVLLAAAPYLDGRSYAEYFQYRRTLTGAAMPRPRWKRVLDAEEGVLGEALGQLFVKEYFNAKAKQRYSDLVEAIRSAYEQRIKKLTWMSDSTKQKALNKLSHITKKVGYPDKWKDFSSLKIDRSSYVLNMQRAAEWWSDYMIGKLNKPVDRTEWDMSPQTYNAYYNPNNNEIVLPAGIFAVPGKRDEELDDAFVYGYAAASTIGHEITHGFDDQGRQFDEKGNLNNWWQPADEQQFKQRAAMIIKQFSEFSPVDTLHVNGDATQGENIADLGGLLLGLDAFKLTDTYKRGDTIGGLTPLQRYFLGYAYAWLYQERKEVLVTQLLTDVHAPARERVNGPVVNVPEFYEAFGVRPGDKMYRADSLRVSIW